jgi:hypothetical protein
MPMTTPSHNIVLCLQYTWGGFFKNEATSYVRPMSWLPKLRFLNKSWCLNSWRSSCWKMSLTFDEITIDVYEITRYNLSGLIWIANRLLSILLKLLKALANVAHNKCCFCWQLPWIPWCYLPKILKNWSFNGDFDLCKIWIVILH